MNEQRHTCGKKKRKSEEMSCHLFCFEKQNLLDL